MPFIFFSFDYHMRHRRRVECMDGCIRTENAWIEVRCQWLQLKWLSTSHGWYLIWLLYIDRIFAYKCLFQAYESRFQMEWGNPLRSWDMCWKKLRCFDSKYFFEWKKKLTFQRLFLNLSDIISVYKIRCLEKQFAIVVDFFLNYGREEILDQDFSWVCLRSFDCCSKIKVRICIYPFTALVIYWNSTI
jgi:hypothetical protein